MPPNSPYFDNHDDQSEGAWLKDRSDKQNQIVEAYREARLTSSRRPSDSYQSPIKNNNTELAFGATFPTLAGRDENKGLPLTTPRGRRRSLLGSLGLGGGLNTKNKRDMMFMELKSKRCLFDDDDDGDDRHMNVEKETRLSTPKPTNRVMRRASTGGGDMSFDRDRIIARPEPAKTNNAVRRPTSHKSPGRRSSVSGAISPSVLGGADLSFDRDRYGIGRPETGNSSRRHSSQKPQRRRSSAGGADVTAFDRERYGIGRPETHSNGRRPSYQRPQGRRSSVSGCMSPGVSGNGMQARRRSSTTGNNPPSPVVRERPSRRRSSTSNDCFSNPPALRRNHTTGGDYQRPSNRGERPSARNSMSGVYCSERTHKQLGSAATSGRRRSSLARNN